MTVGFAFLARAGCLGELSSRPFGGGPDAVSSVRFVPLREFGESISLET